MDIVHASFQASFDSRVERLGDVDLADLRVIFRYFDTDGDGAVSAGQACRMFALVQCEIGQVLELNVIWGWTLIQHKCGSWEKFISMFMKIVDSHVQGPLASEALEIQVENTAPVEEPVGQQSTLQSAGETEKKMRNEKIIEDEWKLLDTYRRGRVSMQELRLFLASCRSTLSLDDTVRLLETYGNALEKDGVEELEFTKEGFLKFRHEYTPKKMASSEDDLSSDDDDENDLIMGNVMLEHRIPDGAELETNQVVNSATSLRAQPRQAQRGPNDNSSDHLLEHELVLNPDELVESDESDGDAAGRKSPHS
ncbi:Hypothetical protein PHPALM_9105 [Phytophthora palmivora]|uniref:EF-hand domain-containing protein n=1 Tax=Phytophthora palmivora TaxID=4796 RepID=A0A2P4Y853_9STRA|nr:Hypothetical protein PHPALM_9105 [Phytophthora palmivora]